MGAARRIVSIKLVTLHGNDQKTARTVDIRTGATAAELSRAMLRALDVGRLTDRVRFQLQTSEWRIAVPGASRRIVATVIGRGERLLTATSPFLPALWRWQETSELPLETFLEGFNRRSIFDRRIGFASKDAEHLTLPPSDAQLVGCEILPRAEREAGYRQPRTIHPGVLQRGEDWALISGNGRAEFYVKSAAAFGQVLVAEMSLAFERASVPPVVIAHLHDEAKAAPVRAVPLMFAIEERTGQVLSRWRCEWPAWADVRRGLAVLG